jgi:adhesin transport system outer membrane protein
LWFSIRSVLLAYKSLVSLVSIKFTVPLCLTFAAGLAFAAVPVQALELREAVVLTLRTNPELGIVVERRKATGFEFEQAGGLFLPTIDFRTAAGEEFTNDASSPAGILPRREVSLTLRQLLFDGSESKYELALRGARRTSASRRVLQTAGGLALDTIEAYLESLRNRGLVALADDTVRAHQNTLAHVTEIAEGGAADVADVKQAESRLARAEDDFARARNRRQDADTAYLSIVGEAVGSLQRPDPPLDALPGTVAEAVALAVAANPAVKLAKSEAAEAQAEYRKSKAYFWPRVNFELAANSSSNVSGSRGSDTGISALLVLNYNLYRGGADNAGRQVAIANLAAARQGVSRAVRVVEEQVRLAWSALQTGRDRVTALRSAVLANEVVRVTYREQFDLNQRSLLDLLDSENDLFVARANLITSEIGVIFGVYRVLANTGGLLGALNVTPPPEALDDALSGVRRRSAPQLPETLPVPEKPLEAAPAPTKPASKKKVIGQASPLPIGRIPSNPDNSQHAVPVVEKSPAPLLAARRVAPRVPLAPFGRASPVAASIKRLPALPFKSRD